MLRLAVAQRVSVPGEATAADIGPPRSGPARSSPPRARRCSSPRNHGPDRHNAATITRSGRGPAHMPSPTVIVAGFHRSGPPHLGVDHRAERRRLGRPPPQPASGGAGCPRPPRRPRYPPGRGARSPPETDGQPASGSRGRCRVCWATFSAHRIRRAVSSGWSPASWASWAANLSQSAPPVIQVRFRTARSCAGATLSDSCHGVAKRISANSVADSLPSAFVVWIMVVHPQGVYPCHSPLSTYEGDPRLIPTWSLAGPERATQCVGWTSVRVALLTSAVPVVHQVVGLP